MTGPVFTYDPAKVIVNVAGYTISGIDTIDVKWHKPAFKEIPGIKGSSTRVRNLNTGCDIHLSLQKTSVSNDVFSSIVYGDRQYGTGQLHVSISDQSGSTIIVSITAYIENFSDLTLSKKLDKTPWKIICQTTTTDTVIGGNWTPSSNLF